MFSWENSEDRIAIAQMNAELRHAQLELLNAERATQELRRRYSAEDLAGFAERDTLHKAIATAGALNQYYASIPKPPSTEAGARATTPRLDGDQILRAITSLSDYLRQQRNYYYPLGAPLSSYHRVMMQPFFSSGLLDGIKIVEPPGTRIPSPPFYAEAKALGFENLPEPQHMVAMTFLDVVVFNERLTERNLFHGLVHAVQFNILEVGLYCDLFIRGFVRTNAHFTVPLEAHAFALDSRFAENRSEGFSVEGQVRLWMKEGRY